MDNKLLASMRKMADSRMISNLLRLFFMGIPPCWFYFWHMQQFLSYPLTEKAGTVFHRIVIIKNCTGVLFELGTVSL